MTATTQSCVKNSGPQFPPVRIHISLRRRVRLQSRWAKAAVGDSERQHGTCLSAFQTAAFPARKASNSEPRKRRGAVTYVLRNGSRSEIRGSCRCPGWVCRCKTVLKRRESPCDGAHATPPPQNAKESGVAPRLITLPAQLKKNTKSLCPDINEVNFSSTI